MPAVNALNLELPPLPGIALRSDGSAVLMPMRFPIQATAEKCPECPHDISEHEADEDGVLICQDPECECMLDVVDDDDLDDDDDDDDDFDDDDDDDDEDDEDE